MQIVLKDGGEERKGEERRRGNKGSRTCNTQDIIFQLQALLIDTDVIFATLYAVFAYSAC